MTTSEDILLQVNHVRHKKSDGVLFLMSERIGWLMASKDTFSVSYQYADIKMQKISPDGKPKIQLQVVLHDGGASTFHFNSPDGERVQRRDRDAVRQQLHRLLPMFQSRVNKELEQKEKLLRENPSLLQLYQDLVITRITSAQQFWQQHAAEFVSRAATVRQEVGVSSAFLADIRPQADGTTGLKYNLNADIIGAIFKTYPAVRRKYVACVPAKMTESEFWTRFFQSHYFHRDRTNLSNKDIFTDCAKQDENEIEAAKSVGVLENPLLDLRHMANSTLCAGYGDPSTDSASDPASAATSSSITSSSASSAVACHSAHSSMIRRFNQHSINVLRASLEASPATAGGATAADGGAAAADGGAAAAAGGGATAAAGGGGVTASASKRPADTTPANNHVKQACLAAKVHFADLEPEPRSAGRPLTLARPDRYLCGPTPLPQEPAAAAAPAAPAAAAGVAAGAADGSNVTSAGTAAAAAAAARGSVGGDLAERRLVSPGHEHSWRQRVHSAVTQWRPLESIPLDAQTAVTVLGELSPGGALMKASSKDIAASADLPDQVKSDMAGLYRSVSELLRHFWHCFPVTSPALEHKLATMHDTLTKFQQCKVQKFEEELYRQYGLGPEVAAHLNHMLAQAHTKYGQWCNSTRRTHR